MKPTTEPDDRPKVADETNIWAGYDPAKVKEALRASAAALAGVDHEQLLRDMHEARAQDSHGRPA